MKRVLSITVIVALLATILTGFGQRGVERLNKSRTIKVGLVCVSDESTAYTANFVRAEDALVEKYGSQVEIVSKFNIPESKAYDTFLSMVKDGCDVIIGTTAGYGKYAKTVAKEHPEVTFCMANASNANESPVLDNYHSFSGTIYQARYQTGVVAGLKLQEMIDQGKIKPSDAVVGYVAAKENAEVISGYTAYFLGIRSVVATAVMKVRYTGAWVDYQLEKQNTEMLIDEGCLVIAQHTDTTAPAVACEEAAAEGKEVYHVGYNSSMMDIAPTTSLVSSRINWEPYILEAVGDVIDGKDIDKSIDAQVAGNDAWAGLNRDWVKIVDLNTIIAAKDTEEKVEKVEEQIKTRKLQVFRGMYTGVAYNDSSKTIDLSQGYEECSDSSTPGFNYLLRDVIIVENEDN